MNVAVQTGEGGVQTAAAILACRSSAPPLIITSVFPRSRRPAPAKPYGFVTLSPAWCRCVCARACLYVRTCVSLCVQVCSVHRRRRGSQPPQTSVALIPAHVVGMQATTVQRGWSLAT